jgi:hypothetical protein
MKKTIKLLLLLTPLLIVSGTQGIQAQDVEGYDCGQCVQVTMGGQNYPACGGWEGGTTACRIVEIPEQSDLGDCQEIEMRSCDLE